MNDDADVEYPTLINTPRGIAINEQCGVESVELLTEATDHNTLSCNYRLRNYVSAAFEYSRHILCTMSEAIEPKLPFMYSYCTILSTAMQVFLGITVSLFDPNSFATHTAHPISVVLIFLVESTQALLLILTTRYLVNRIRTNSLDSPFRLMHMFLANCVAFAGFYTLCYAADKDSFYLQGSSGYESVSEVFALFFYYSISTMSSTGFGDITPLLFIPQSITLIQTLIAIMYFAGIFAMAMGHFRTRMAESNQFQVDSRPSNDHLINRSHVRDTTDITSQIKRWVKHNLFLATLFSQGLNVLILCTIDYKMDQHSQLQFNVLFTVCVIQIVQFAFVFGMCLKLVRQIQYLDVSTSFLMQSFLATIIFFAGIYFSISLFNTSAFVVPVLAATGNSKNQFTRFWNFVYFSTTCQTHTGLGDIVPIAWLSRLVVSFHIFVSVLYSVVILGLGLAKLVDRSVPSDKEVPDERFFHSEERSSVDFEN